MMTNEKENEEWECGSRTVLSFSYWEKDREVWKKSYWRRKRKPNTNEEKKTTNGSNVTQLLALWRRRPIINTWNVQWYPLMIGQLIPMIINDINIIIDMTV